MVNTLIRVHFNYYFDKITNNGDSLKHCAFILLFFFSRGFSFISSNKYNFLFSCHLISQVRYRVEHDV